MSRQTQWLFELPASEVSYANLQYETPLENEWELSMGNYYDIPLEDEWEVNPIRRVSRTGGVSRRNRLATPNQRHRGQNNQHERLSLSKRVTETEPRILIATIDRFASGSYLLKKHQFDRLDDLTTALKKKNDQDRNFLFNLKLKFVGHTDNVGKESKSNFHLGARRAMEVESFVRQFLKKKVPNLPTIVESKSSKDPISPNSNQTAKGRELNRRVQVFSNLHVN